MIVAVDGPGGAGKSTVSREVAKRLGFFLLDTGAMYRCVAYQALAEGCSLEDEAAVGEVARRVEISFKKGARGQQVWLNGQDVSAQIRSGEAGQSASKVAALPSVRAALLDHQRKLGRAMDAVVEGRDIGTVVFPDADLKVYYTASVEARAARRFKELQERGIEASLDAVAAEIEARDHRDMNRAVAPLRQAEDALVFDTSEMDYEQSCAAFEALVRTRLGL